MQIGRVSYFTVIAQGVDANSNSQDLRVDTLGRPINSIGNVSAGKLSKSGTISEQVACVLASTDYAASAPIPAGTKYVTVYCTSDSIVAVGEATTGTVGVGVAAGTSPSFPVSPTGVAADDTVHVQSPTAGAVVRLTYMGD